MHAYPTPCHPHLFSALHMSLQPSSVATFSLRKDSLLLRFFTGRNCSWFYSVPFTYLLPTLCPDFSYVFLCLVTCSTCWHAFVFHIGKSLFCICPMDTLRHTRHGVLHCFVAACFFFISPPAWTWVLHAVCWSTLYLFLPFFYFCFSFSVSHGLFPFISDSDNELT